MGDQADMVLDGTLCCVCGVTTCSDDGPAMCEDCWRDRRNRKAWPGAKRVTDAEVEASIGRNLDALEPGE